MNEILSLYNDAAIKRGFGPIDQCHIRYNVFYAYKMWHIDFQVHFFAARRTWKALTSGYSLEEAEGTVRDRVALFVRQPKEDSWYDYQWGKD